VFRRWKLGQQRVEAVWGDRQLLDRARPAERIIDPGGDCGARSADAGFAGAFDAERVERRRCILEEPHLDVRDLGNGRHHVTGQGNRLWLPGGVIHKLLEQRGTDALSRTADDLPLES